MLLDQLFLSHACITIYIGDNIERNNNQKALLLQVGIDKQSAGIYGPIFEDRSFEYIPKPAKNQAGAGETYNQRQGRKRLPLAVYLPRTLKNAPLHDDPEFETYTFGITSPLPASLRELREGDLLVFYAGLQPFHADPFRIGLYIIGYFTVKDVVEFRDLSTIEAHLHNERLSHNPHVKAGDTRTAVIVIGDEMHSTLLDRAILLAKAQANHKRGSKAAFTFSDEMVEIIGVSGTIESYAGPIFVAGADHLANLKRILGISEDG